MFPVLSALTEGKVTVNKGLPASAGVWRHTSYDQKIDSTDMHPFNPIILQVIFHYHHFQG